MGGKLLNSLLHIHEYGIMDERGYQECIHCKKSFYIGLPPIEAYWEVLERIEFLDKKGKIYKISFIQQCKNTGELKSFTIKK